MKLYSGPVSMFGAKVEMALIEKGLQADVEMVPFTLRELYSPKHVDVLRVNPKAEVPVLIDGTLELYDSTQIFEYFEDLNDTIPLWPKGARQRARARQLELASDEIFFPHVVSHMPRRRTSLTEEDLRLAKDRIYSFYETIDNRLGECEYLVGPFSYADIAFFCAQFFASFLGVPAPENLENLSAWKSRMRTRRSTNSVLGAMAEYLTKGGIPASI